MAVASRFWNFIRGMFWQGQKSLEQANPEAVYEMAIQKTKVNYQKMQAAVGKLAAERNRLRNLVSDKTKMMAAINEDVEAALSEAQAGSESAAELGEELVLEQQSLQAELDTVRNELAASEKLVGDYMGKLRIIENQARQLESKKSAMIAKLQSANARKSFNDMVSGMSTNAEESAVADIDKYIEGVSAQADLADEMSGQTREERRRKLRESARERTSKSKFQEMLEARQQQASGASGGAAKARAKDINKGGLG